MFPRIVNPGVPEPSDAVLLAIDVFNPVYGRHPLPAPGPNTDRVERQKSTGVYSQYQISFADTLEVRVGGRYDDYRQKLHNRRNGSITRGQEAQFSPQAGVVFHATSQMAVYAAYGENFRPLSGTDRFGDAFDPNETESLEVGVKYTSADGRITGTAAIFQIDQSNIQAVDPDNSSFFVAAGKAASQGVELDMQGELLPGLDLWLSYTYVDAEYEDGFQDAVSFNTIPKGSALLNVPENTLSIQLAYEMPLMGRNLRFGGGFLYVDERVGEAGMDFELPDYNLVKLFAEMEVTPALLVRLDADNVLDEEWFPNSFASVWVQPGEERTFRLSARYRF